jgi:hypothetical protein
MASPIESNSLTRAESTLTERRLIAQNLSGLTRRARTSPGRMRLLSVIAALGTAAVAVTALVVLHAKHDATQFIMSAAQPSMVHASNAYRLFSDADATASVAFITGDGDLVYGHARYSSDLTYATAELAGIARTASATPDIDRNLQLINEQLPTYTGLVETARSNNRQGFPVGAAYLRQASETMRTTILPAVLAIYREEAGKLGHAYHSGLSRRGPAVLLTVAAGLVALMVITQFWLARRTRRTFNLGWLAATVVIAALAIMVTGATTSNSHNLESARRLGSDATGELSSARILAVRAQADESLALIARGSGLGFSQDFDEVASRLRGAHDDGLIPQVQDTLRRVGAAGSADVFGTDLSAFFTEHQNISKLEDRGQYSNAIERTSGVEAPRVTAALAVLDHEIVASQARFVASMQRASFSATAWDAIVLIGAAVGCALIAAGINPRLREYR